MGAASEAVAEAGGTKVDGAKTCSVSGGGAIPETLWASPLEVDGKIFGFVGAAEDEEEEVVEIPAVAAAFLRKACWASTFLSRASLR